MRLQSILSLDDSTVSSSFQCDSHVSLTESDTDAGRWRRWAKLSSHDNSSDDFPFLRLTSQRICSRIMRYSNRRAIPRRPGILLRHSNYPARAMDVVIRGVIVCNSVIIPLSSSVVLTAQQVGKCPSVSPRTVWRYDSAGAIPKPIRRGRLVRWRADEIDAWIDAGCPDRATWHAMNSK